MGCLTRTTVAVLIRCLIVFILLTGCSNNGSSRGSGEEETLASISITPENHTITAGETLQYEASGTYLDGTTIDLTASVEWSSSDTSVASFNDTGSATAHSEGTVSITASSGNISCSTSLTVIGSSTPLSPSGVRASAGNRLITLRWDNVQGATSYCVYWSNNPGVTRTNGKKITNAASPFSHTGLTNGTSYYYVVTALNSHGESPESMEVTSTPTTSPAISSIIINHTCTRLDAIPSQRINQAKTDLHIAYGHTSHGSQVVEGMRGLVLFRGDLYAFNSGAGSLDLRDNPFPNAQDLGSSNWEESTRYYLDRNPDVNVVIWSWCGQVSTATEAYINTYLSRMDSLEDDYPGVTFVYMTGHLDGTGLEGNLHRRNEQIREYCRSYNKILYDFADIETYDPSGYYYGDKHPTGGCNYDYNNDGITSENIYTATPLNGDRNWAIDWQDSHVEGIEWYDCDSAHSQPLNANQKAYAAWWLWARLAGWDGQ